MGGHNVCLAADSGSNVLCDDKTTPECQNLAYCSHNIEKPKIDLKNRESISKALEEFKVEKLRYTNMLRWVCVKDKERCPNNFTGGVLQFDHLGQLQNVKNHWDMA
jgi:hypothetical protein